DQDGKPLPGIGMHISASHPAVDDQDLAIAMTTDAQGHVFVPRRVIHAARWRSIAGSLKQARAFVHAEFRSSGYAAIPPQAGYGYANPGEPGEGGAYWYSETGHVVSQAILYRCVSGVRRYGC